MKIELDREDASTILYLLESMSPHIEEYEGLRERYACAYIEALIEEVGQEKRDEIRKRLRKKHGINNEKS
jgi:hypothetical protein